MRKRSISLFIALLLLWLVAFCPSVTALQVYKNSNEKKIDSFLLQQLTAAEVTDKFNVSAWVRDINDEAMTSAVEQCIVKEVKNQDKKDKLLKYIEQQKFTEENSKTPQSLMAELEQMQQAPLGLSSDDYQYLVETQRMVSSSLYQKQNQDIFNALFPKEKQELFRTSAAEQPEILYTCQYAPNIDMTLTKEQIYNIAASDDVEAVYYIPSNAAGGLLPEPDIDQIDIQLQEDALSADAEIPTVWQKITGIEYMRDVLGKDGTGIKIGQIEHGVLDLTFSCFGDAVENQKIHIINGRAASHASYDASIMIGKTDNYTGAVPNAELYAAVADNDNPSLFKSSIESMVSEGVNVINASAYFEYRVVDKKVDYYSNEYTDVSKWLDHISLDHKVTFVLSSGNTYKDKVLSGSMAYNTVTVGNLNDNQTEKLSDDKIETSSAYCADESKPYKPDLLAPGSCVTTALAPNMTGGGTSAAAPVVTSAVAQLMQAQPYLKTNPELVKALLLCGTTHMSQYSFEDSDTPAMTRQGGAGMLNVYNSFTALSSSSYPKYATGSLEHGEMGPITKNLLVSKTHEPLVIALTWTKTTSFNSISDHYTIDNLGAASLSFLKLEVTTPRGTVFSSFNVTGNVQRVSIPPWEAVSGTYRIRVSRNGPSGHTTYYAITALNGDVML